ncbi:MAG: ABC transporter substrate-binding protein [Acidobacteriota bacterium]
MWPVRDFDRVFFQPVALILTLAFALLTLVGCGAVEEARMARRDGFALPADPLVVDTGGRFGGTLHYALPGEPTTFNFLAARESRSKLVTHLTTATLLDFDPVQQKVIAGICSGWTVSEDGRKVTLNLREGVRFSDGVPVTAADVLFTFEKIYEEGSQNVVRDSLLVSGRPLQVTSTDDLTVDLEFAETSAAAEYILTTVPVLPRHRFQEPGKKIEEYWNLETPPEEMAGLGPFVLQVRRPGEQSVFRFNPHYWKVDSGGNRLPYLDQVVVHYIEERNTQLLRFQAGELDLLDHLLRPEDFLQLRGQDLNLQDAGPSSNLSIFWLNLNVDKDPGSNKSYLSPAKRKWFGSRKFRQAISTAISRDAIVQNVYLGRATPAWSLVPSSFVNWHADDVPQYRHDPERARRLLREAGFSWRRGESGEVLLDSEGRVVKIEILTRSDDILGKTAAIIQQDLERVGIQASLRQEEFRTLISRILGSRDYDAVIMNLELPVEPADYANVLISSGPMHMWHPNQSEPATEWEERVDDLMLRQMSTLSSSIRRQLFREIQHILGEQVPLVPLIYKDVLIAGQRDLRNVRPTSFFPYGLWNVWELWKMTHGK